MKKTKIGLSVVSALLLSGPANAALIVGGNANTKLIEALDTLGESYTTLASGFPRTSQVSTGDILIWGQDGGNGTPDDFNTFLNAGGDIILAGGSNLNEWRSWSTGYFNTTNTDMGWHQDPGWNSNGSTVLTQYVPGSYSFENSAHTFHMQAFLPTADTFLYAGLDNGDQIGAFREYDNGGSFNYMALDLGIRDGDEAFISGWLQGSLQAARNGIQQVDIPEPSSIALFGLSLLGMGLVRRKK